MKAVTWQRWISICVGALALSLAIQPVLASQGATNAQPGLPVGLPELPQVGEAMQRNLLFGLAIDGFDPVAYQASGRATPGKAEFELVYRGVAWRFASAANRAAFRDAPKIYEPEFSGFDPLGVAQGHAVETDPRHFAVIGSRLYLFRTAQNRDAFLRDTAQLPLARAQWGEVYQLVAR